MSSASRVKGEDWKKSVDHEADFASTTIYFTMTSHTQGGINLGAAVRRLLRADVAVAAAWPSETAIRVTPRLRSLGQSITKAQKLQKDFQNFQDQRSPKAFIKYAIQHPRLFTQNLFTRSEHLIEDAPQEDEASPSTKIADALSFGQEVLIDAQKVAAVERAIDESLFGGKSRNDDEFVRLNLRGSYHDFIVPSTSDIFYVVFEPRLMLHRSGVVQLTIAIHIDEEISTSQLVSLSRSDKAMIARSKIPEPLLSDLPIDKTIGEWLEQLDAGARLRGMKFEEPSTMTDILERHLQAVGGVIARPLPNDWNTHATVITGVGSCCKKPKDWKSNHEIDIARVVTRVESSSPINDSLKRAKDLATFSDHVLYTNMGSSTYIQLIGDPPIAIEQLDTVLIIEHALLQYFQLRQLEKALSEDDLYGTRLGKVQRAALQVFSAMRQHEIRYGTAQEIVRELLSSLGAEEMRRTIESGLNLAVQANATHAAEKQSRRSIRLTLTATVLAALVAIPTLSDLLDEVRMIDPTSVLGHLLLPLRWAASMGNWGPWIIIAALLAALFLMVIWTQLRRGGTRLLDAITRQTSKGGPPLPKEFTLTVTRYESQAAHNHRNND